MVRPPTTGAAGRTALLATHRLTGLSAVDEILVLDEGRVIQRGRHDELVRRPGWYRDAWLSERLAAASSDEDAASCTRPAIARSARPRL